MEKLKLPKVTPFNVRVRQAVRSKINADDVKMICQFIDEADKSATGAEAKRLKAIFLSIINY